VKEYGLLKRIIEGAGSIEKTNKGETYIFGGYKVARIDYLYNYREYDEICHQLNNAKRDLNSLLIKEGDVANSSEEKLKGLQMTDESNRVKFFKKKQDYKQKNSRIGAKESIEKKEPVDNSKEVQSAEAATGKQEKNSKEAEIDHSKPVPLSTSCCLCCKKEKYIRINPKTKRAAASIGNLLNIKEFLLQAYNSRPLKPAKLEIYKDFSLNFQLKFIECNYLNSKVCSRHRS